MDKDMTTHFLGQSPESNDPFAEVFGYVPQGGFTNKVKSSQETDDISDQPENAQKKLIGNQELLSGDVRDNEQTDAGIKQVRRRGKSRNVSSEVNRKDISSDIRKHVTLNLDGELLRKCRCLELYHNLNFSELIRWLIAERYDAERKDILKELPKMLGIEDI